MALTAPAARRFWLQVALCVVALSVQQAAPAQPSIWAVAKDPRLKRADELLALAERSRMPADDILGDPLLLLWMDNPDDLGRQLNARAALLIKIAHGADLPDPRLRYFLGDALVKADKEYLAEGRAELERALAEAPDSPLAADAWFALAIAQGKLRDQQAERNSYTMALTLQWDPEERAIVLLNRAESSMSLGELTRAITDYRLSRAQSRAAATRSLATWGLAVATERNGDLPSALSLAREAASVQFGNGSRSVVALDLPDTFFTPAYEQHYYRALAAMGEANVERDPDKARALLQTAQLLWSLYLAGAEKDAGRWVANALRHRAWCQARIATREAPARETATRAEKETSTQR